MVFNFSKDSDYHTQRNNKYIPLESCNSTSMVMALKQAGYDFDHINTEQPEDLLTLVMTSSMGTNMVKELASWAWDSKLEEPTIPPNEIHVILEWATNHIMLGKKVDRFTTNAKLTTIIATLLTHGGIVLSGIFPQERGALSHMVSLAGFITDNDSYHVEPEHITHFIIDDPYGNFRTQYEDHRGNNIEITNEEFMAIFKDIGDRERKWAHIVKNSEAGKSVLE